MESLADLFGRYRTLTPKGKPLDERAELIRYFSEEFKREPRVVGVRLAHYKLDELYGLQSAYKDRLQRNGRDTARKYFWWVTKTKRA